MKGSVKYSLQLVCLISLMVLNYHTLAQIDIDPVEPVKGEEVSVRLENPSSFLFISYRPNSTVARMDTIKANPPVNHFIWTPEYAGVVRLSTSDAARNVSVRYAGVSWTGILVMILAGVILLGGATISMIMLFRRREQAEMLIDIERMPDT